MRYAKYKKTGIPWLPEVPEEWECRPVKEMVSCNDESISETDTPDDAEIQYVEIGDVEFARGISNVTVMKFCEAPSRARRITRPGDVIVSTVRTYLRAVAKIVQNDLIVSTGFAVLRPKTVSGDYLAYACASSGFTDQVVAQSTGISYPAISSSKLKRCRIPLPPLPTQRAIVAYLDAQCGKIDSLVAAKEKEIELLKELKQATIAEAVTGKVEVEKRGGGGRRRLKPSGIPWLPQVPEGWEVMRLASLFNDDVAFNKNFIFKRAFKFNYGTLIPKNEIGDPEEYRDVYVKYSVLQTDDIVINGLNLNYDFNSLRVACSPSDGIITSAYIVCRPRKGVESEYYTYLFKAMDYCKMFHGMGTGIRLTLSFRELRCQLLPVPPREEQERIVAYIERETAKIDSAAADLTKQVAALKEYKQRLIADVVTGQEKVVGSW